MKNLKRALSFAVAAVMLVGMMVVGASASFNDADEIEHTEAVNTLVALGIVKGKDTGDFDPTGSVTRAEMAKMIYVAKTGKDTSLTGAGLYADTKGHWAAGYIDYCTNQGIVSGDTAGNFNPNANVTGTQAAKMLLTVLGYDAVTEGFVNNAAWSLNIDARAYEKELYEDVDTDPAAALDRENAAQMIYNALQASKVRYSIVGIVDGTSVSEAYDTGATIMEDLFDVKEVEGVMTSISYDEDNDNYIYSVAEDWNTDDEAIHTFKSAEDYSDLFMMNTKVLYKVANSKTTVYGIYAEDSVVIGEGLISGISISDGKVKFAGTTYKYDFDVKGDELAKSDIPAYAYNVETATDVAAAQASADVKVIDLDNNGKIDHVVFVPFTVAEVTYVGKDSFKAGTTYDFDEVNGADDIAKGDFVKITAAANTVDDKVAFEIVDTVIEGKVTSTKTNSSDKVTDVKIDGTWYKLATADFLSLGDKCADMAVVNGYIFTKGEAKSTVAADDYAVILNIETEAEGLSDYPRAILLLTTGEKITVDLAIEDEDENPITYTKEMKNTLVTYEVDDDVYTLTTADGDGFDGVADGQYDDEQIGMKDIADDAVIFIKGSSSTKVITGAELKKADTLGTDGVVHNAYYNEDSSTGFKTIVLAYVSGSISSTSDNLYGYVTAKPQATLDEDGKTVYDITMGDEVLTTKSGTKITGIVKESLVVYKTNADGLITSIDLITTANAIDKNVAAIKTAVTAYNGSKIEVEDLEGTYDIDDDTVIIYINSDDVDYAEGGEISLADKTEPDENDDQKYIDNVYIAVDGEDDVVLLVVDVNNEMKA